MEHTASEPRVLGPSPDGSYYYVYGASDGYTDGTTNDPDQRFISRLYGLNVGVREHSANALGSLRLYPDPATTQTTVEYDLQATPKDAAAMVSDMAGRERLCIALCETHGKLCSIRVSFPQASTPCSC